MAGSQQYLDLLDNLPYAPASWSALDSAWETLVQNPITQENLKILAATAFQILSEAKDIPYEYVIKDAKALPIAKNAGYAGADNPDPWANFRLATLFGVTAAQGSLVRMSDKYIRIQNLRKNPSNDRVGESIIDTLADLAAYALITICLGVS